tara:strand:+ start:6130 stop:6483 length:354 start_codon:yes stop_codon:yes gene_type:complete
MDILKPILDIYDIKKSVLLFYLDPKIVSEVDELAYLDDNNELFLNDKVYCIDRSTLTLDHIGIIHAIRDKGDTHLITIKQKGNYSIHLEEKRYHIFIKRRRSKQNDRDFYKALLNSL